MSRCQMPSCIGYCASTQHHYTSVLHSTGDISVESGLVSLTFSCCNLVPAQSVQVTREAPGCLMSDNNAHPAKPARNTLVPPFAITNIGCCSHHDTNNICIIANTTAKPCSNTSRCVEAGEQASWWHTPTKGDMCCLLHQERPAKVGQYY